MFGKLVGGENVLDTLEKLPLKDGTERPAKTVRITEIVMCVTPLNAPRSRVIANTIFRYQDPFEEYKTRLAKKLAKKAQAVAGGDAAAKAAADEKQKKDGDDVNWFGLKVGTERSGFGAAGTAGTGVGKYLGVKRSLDSPSTISAAAPPDEGRKKRKLGFGEFEGW